MDITNTISSIDGALEESHYVFQPREGVGNVASLVDLIFSTLRRAGLSVAFVETFTGGMICDLLVNTPNISEIFIGGLVAYRTSTCEHFLKISQTYLDNVGFISKNAAIAMAESCAQEFNADFAVASCGIAGPDGGSITSPVGRGWVSIKTPSRMVIQSLNFSDTPHDRNLIRERATYAILKILVQVIFEDLSVPTRIS